MGIDYVLILFVILLVHRNVRDHECLEIGRQNDRGVLRVLKPNRDYENEMSFQSLKARPQSPEQIFESVGRQTHLLKIFQNNNKLMAFRITLKKTVTFSEELIHQLDEF
jgi:hypothetical protein